MHNIKFCILALCVMVTTCAIATAVRCPHQEPIDCPKNHRKADCRRYKNVREWCPYFCGVCKESDRPSCAQDSNCHMSPAGCAYIGKQPSAAQCAKMGVKNSGKDSFMCSNLGHPDWTCTGCRKFNNVKKQFCPYMCGYCQSPCGSLFCKNGGVMDPKTCTCTCQEIFSGSDCSTKTCPQKDKFWCSQYQKKGYCDYYSQAKYWCPYLCGLC